MTAPSPERITNNPCLTPSQESMLRFLLSVLAGAIVNKDDDAASQAVTGIIKYVNTLLTRAASAALTKHNLPHKTLNDWNPVE